jgi:hypothetical protein
MNSTKSATSIEPQWEIGKHDWRNNNCMICGLQRLYEVSDDTGARRIDRHDVGEHVVRMLYESPLNEELEAFASPCVPRLAGAVDGLYTMKEAAGLLGISIHVFKNRQLTRGIRPTAVVKKNNVYLFRSRDIHKIGLSEKEWRATSRSR